MMRLPNLFSKPRKYLFLGLLTLSLLEALALFAITLLVKQLAMNIAGSSSLSLSQIAIAIATVTLLLALLHLKVISLAEKLGMHYGNELRSTLFRAALTGPSRHIGSTMARMLGDLNSSKEWVSRGLANSIVAAASLIAAIAGLLLIDQQAGLLVSGISVIATLFVILLCLVPLNNYALQLRRCRGRLSSFLGDVVTGRDTVNHFRRHNGEHKRLEQHNKQLQQLSVAQANIIARITLLPTLTVPFAITLITLLLINGHTLPLHQPGAWGMLLFSLALLAGSLLAISQGVAHYINYRVACRRLSELLQHAPSRPKSGKVRLATTQPLSLQIEQIADIHLTSPLNLEAGERVLVHGPSGCGKSRFFHQLLHFNRPCHIQIDGTPLDQIDSVSQRQALQLVSPNIPILRGSITRNMQYGHRKTTARWQQQVIECCQLQSIVGENGQKYWLPQAGSNLSSSLAARLRLARALICQPGLLLIDDPLFLYDPQAQQALYHAHQILPCTTLLAAPTVPEIAGFNASQEWQFVVDQHHWSLSVKMNSKTISAVKGHTDHQNSKIVHSLSG